MSREWRWSQHARERMKEMGVEEEEVYRVLTDPELTYDQPRYGANRKMYQAGRLGIPVAINPGGGGVIVSVLWRLTEQWERKQA